MTWSNKIGATTRIYCKRVQVLCTVMLFKKKGEAKDARLTRTLVKARTGNCTGQLGSNFIGTFEQEQGIRAHRLQCTRLKRT
jgi:hypothetical protein